MARESINMLKLRQILRLNNEKKPVRQISELLGLHRKAVTKYIALYEASGFSYKDIASYSDVELHEKLCAREKKELEALPAEKYEIKEYSRLTVNKNCHIWLKSDEHYYNAPYQYIGKKVKVVISARSVEIYGIINKKWGERVLF